MTAETKNLTGAFWQHCKSFANSLAPRRFRGFGLRFRLLPCLIVVAMLSLSFRLNGIWEGYVLAAPTEEGAASEAEASPGQSMTPEGGLSAQDLLDESELDDSEGLNQDLVAADSASELQPAGSESDRAQDASRGDTAAASNDPEQKQENQQVANLPADPFALTDDEIELLQALAARRQEIEERAQQLRERTALLQAAETRIDQKIGELKALQRTIEALIVQHDEQEEAKLRSLVKIYESMKPKEAARIFEELDMEVLLEVVDRMKERKSAPVLAKMNPTRAKEVTLELAARRQLPLEKE